MPLTRASAAWLIEQSDKTQLQMSFDSSGKYLHLIDECVLCENFDDNKSYCKASFLSSQSNASLLNAI